MRKFYQVIFVAGVAMAAFKGNAHAQVVYVGGGGSKASPAKNAPSAVLPAGREAHDDKAAFAGGGLVPKDVPLSTMSATHVTPPPSPAAQASAPASSPAPVAQSAPASSLSGSHAPAINSQDIREVWAKRAPNLPSSGPQFSTKANIVQENNEQQSIQSLINSGKVPAGAFGKTRGYSPDANMTFESNRAARRILKTPHSSYGPRQGGDGLYFAAAGDTLYSVLQQWAGLNGWKVQYDAQLSYPLDSEVSLHGSFIECAASLIEAFRRSVETIPQYKFYSANKVLRIWNYDGGL